MGLSPCIDNLGTLGQEEIGNVDGLLHGASSVIPQVQDEGLCPFFFHLHQC